MAKDMKEVSLAHLALGVRQASSLEKALVIKDTVKELNYERYRIMCIVSIGQLDEQGIQLVSRCVWDTNRDTSASGSYKNKSLFAVATVFAVYLE